MIQLKVRTEYSFGETYAPIDRVIERLKAVGCTAAGIVDRASTWGHVKWFDACVKAGITPLLGVELIVADEDDTQTSMWFLASDNVSELYKWSSKAHNQRVKTKRGSKPRLYKADVLAMPDSIIKFAGDVVDEGFLVACNAVIDTSPASRVLNSVKLGIADRNDLPVVEVSDNAYSFPDDRKLFEFISDRGLKPTKQHILGPEEFATLGAAEVIVERCKGLQLPQAPMIKVEGDLEALCRAGIPLRFPDGGWTDAHEQRLQHELSTIAEKDFDSYFLIVSDMVRYAKRHMLVGPSRGSAAGSLVCYLAQITEIDPIPPGLFFERFVDVNRTDLPDIDLDFPDNKRHMVFEYMADKYGAENVSHIGTISRLKPKSALIQVCKRLKIPPEATGAVKVAMIERSSADSRANQCLQDTLETTEPGKKLLSMYPEVALAANLEGHASHTGVHAAGLLVANQQMETYATITDDGTAQVDKTDAERLGLLKIDVLGLRTLGILEDSGVPIDWYNLKFDDQKTFDVFNQGRLCSIFQFEGNALRAVAKDIEFKSLREIDAVTALARPGPFGGGVTQQYVERKKGARYAALHPLVERHMAETYGLPVYQEQTLAIVREIGKFSWKDTGTIRKAMSKRMGKEFFETFWEKFREGATSQGIGEQEARATWELINAMGAWQMNKAHTYSYAVISYWTAYLKAHHPLEFAAANLRNAKDNDSALELLREMVREGIEYVPFDVDLSEENWSAKNGKLVGGFQALKGFGPKNSAKYVACRAAGQLTEAMRQKAMSAESAFSNIFPIRSAYGEHYANPAKMDIIGDVREVAGITGDENDSIVFIGELIYKNARNANEDVNVKKRGGRLMTGPLDFVDIRLRDDSGTIAARIGRYDFNAMGRDLLDNVPIGAHLLVRARFANGIRFGFIQKWRRLDV